MSAPRPLRLASYNVEWFNALFGSKDQILDDSGPSSRYDTSRSQQLGALAIVFTALNADGVMIVEAPDTSRSQGRSSVRALENFARMFGLRQRAAITGFASQTEQEISFLYDPAVLSLRHDPKGTAFAPRFDQPHRQDLDGDGVPEQLQFSKPPLELEVMFGTQMLRLIGVHAKSKSSHGARTEAEVRRLSIENRRKQLGECQWLRLRVEAHLAAKDALIVMGDFNDGPGQDDFEKLFGLSGVEVVLGTDAPPELRLYDPNADMALRRNQALQPVSARFWNPKERQFFEAMLDFIMVSPDLRGAKWRIWHPLNDPGIAAASELREALLQASDHFPVTLDLEF